MIENMSVCVCVSVCLCECGGGGGVTWMASVGRPPA